MTHENGYQTFSDALEAAHDGRKTQSDTLSEEDQTLLALASELAETDFSAAYGEPTALRRHLLNRHGASRVGWSPIGDKIAMFTITRRLVQAVITITMLGTLVFARFSPVLADSRQDLATWLVTEGLPAEVIRPIFGVLVGAEVVIHTDGGETRIPLSTVSSFEEAQAAAAFILKQPAALPDGFTLKSGSVSEDGNRVDLSYDNGSGGVLAFSQSTVAPLEGVPAVPSEQCILLNGPDSAEPGEFILNGTPPTSKPGATIQNGEPGPVDPGAVIQSGNDKLPCGDPRINFIRWEADGVYYQIVGTLSQAELQAVADSVQ